MSPSTQNLLATMVTITTYGTWLPGDLRGYVKDGIILPGNPELLDSSRQRLKSPPVYLSAAEQETAFRALVHAAHEFHYGYCFDRETVEARRRYIRRHHGWRKTPTP